MLSPACAHPGSPRFITAAPNTYVAKATILEMGFGFTKLQGNGNDFILIDSNGKPSPGDERRVRGTLLRRRFGIGADGVLFLQASDNADVRMRLLQPDESEANMCGNGIRCLAKYAYDAGTSKSPARSRPGPGSSR